ncbi:hypothetical protein SPSYN_02877 [Sporotomaculum syntrophicum]|uniref:Phosphatidylglycerol lysyltransferase n=1 Tax=Sporotomaculum syntrophicum TaxID=182264 RepID=A0A9D3AVD7_9FIRM|nr:lysylphosphatidylglycerol synthase transmembrane domain-containing protein [Sporotomaculum syntrophicum]KAF1083965.1 hypothetical protein SPSYN_02877 [Sporotomaculum syntrophicum]
MAAKLKFLISVLLLGLLIYQLDGQALRGVFLTANPGWLLLAAALIVLSMVVSVEKWSQILKAESIYLPWYQLWKAYWIGLFFNNFLPSSIGGDGIRIFLVGRNISNLACAASSVIIERIMATLGLALTGLLTGLVVKPNWQVSWLFVGLTLVATGLLVFLMWGSLPASVVQRNGRLSNFLRTFLAHGRSVRGHGQRLLLAGCLSVLFQLTVVAVNYAIFRGLQVNSLGWLELVYIIPAISAIAMVPIGINGYGVREGAYVILLASYGVAGSAALGASLLFAVLVSLCSLYGGLLWLVNRERNVLRERLPDMKPEVN